MKNNKVCVLSFCCVVLLISLLAPLSGRAQTVDPLTYYRGKAITIIVPFAAGGGTDIMTRWLAPWLTKYIPGNPTVSVVNMPGAGGMIGANHVYNVVKQDGLTLMTSSSGNNMMWLLKAKGVEFDQSKMPVALATSTGFIFFAKGDLYKEFKDIFDKELIIFGHQPAGTSTTLQFLVIKELLGFKTKKLILAYEGSGDAWRAYVAGEINTSGIPTPGYLSYIKALETTGEAKMLFQTEK